MSPWAAVAFVVGVIGLALTLFSIVAIVEQVTDALRRQSDHDAEL